MCQRPRCGARTRDRVPRKDRAAGLSTLWPGSSQTCESLRVRPAGESLPRNEPLRAGTGLDPLADLLRALDDDSLRAADIAEPVAVLVGLHLADEFSAAGSQAGNDGSRRAASATPIWTRAANNPSILCRIGCWSDRNSAPALRAASSDAHTRRPKAWSIQSPWSRRTRATTWLRLLREMARARTGVIAQGDSSNCRDEVAGCVSHKRFERWKECWQPLDSFGQQVRPCLTPPIKRSGKSEL
jgi:hypothetical protein